MKKLFLICIAATFGVSGFAQHSLQQLWLSDSTLKNPESVLVDAKAKVLYVSNIGEFGTKNVGFISKLGLDGKITQRDWVTGLNSPKGIGMSKGNLYAAEDNGVAVIDIKSGKITKRIPIEGAEMLNDITIDSKGIAFVSDSKTGKVHRIENDKPAVYLEGLDKINGLLSVGDDLYILADGKFKKSDAKKNITQIVDGIEGGADGIEMVSKNEFLLTAWGGTIYLANTNGTKELLSDTRDKKINAADLGYDPATKTLYVPRMTSHTVIAYKLK